MSVFLNILRARSYGLLRLRPASKATRLDCVGGKCGLCCVALGGGVIVTGDESRQLPNHSIKRFGEIIVIRSVVGTCCLLKDKLCTVYEHRPRGCHEYPWYNVNGQLYYDKGCPGIRFDKDNRPDVAEISPVSKYFPTQRWVWKPLLRLLRLW